MKNYTIQLFGSSIMEGRIGAERVCCRWYERMRHELSEQFPATCFSVYNGAVGGESIRELMAHFDRDLRGHTPDLFLAMFGWNNFVMENADRFVSVEEQKQWMEMFFSMLPVSAKVIGIITQPMLDEHHYSHFSRAYDSVRQKYGGVNVFHDLERNAAMECFDKHGVKFLNLSELMKESPERYILLSDGIHLNTAGHQLFASAVCDFIHPLLAEEGCC